MKPVDQLFLVDRDGHGDCLRACVASVLELPATVVPDFRLFGPNWMWALIGFASCDFDTDPPTEGYWIANGPTVRGTRHSVVYSPDGLAHDPHPSRAGLLSIDGVIVVRGVRPDVLGDCKYLQPTPTQVPPGAKESDHA